MAKLEELPFDKATKLKELGQIVEVGTDLPHTQTEWFDRIPIISKYFIPSPNRRFEREIKRTARRYNANAVAQELLIIELVAGSEYPVELHFYRKT